MRRMKIMFALIALVVMTAYCVHSSETPAPVQGLRIEEIR
jgi:hypothetical protein